MINLNLESTTFTGTNGGENQLNHRAGNKKITHKDTDGRPLRPGALRRYMRRYDLVPNIITNAEKKRARWDDKKRHILVDSWDPGKGGILYKRLKADEIGKYQDTVKVTVRGKRGRMHSEYFVPVRAIKAEPWIFPRGRQLSKQDTMKIPLARIHPDTTAYIPEAGSELELGVQNGLDAISERTQDILEQEKAGTSDEFLRHTREMNFGHSPDLRKQAKSDLRAIKAFAEEVSRQGTYILPVSMYPDEISREDVFNHDYMWGMVDKIGMTNLAIYGPSQSWQVMLGNKDKQKGRENQGTWDQVSGILKALTLDSTIGYGTTRPNLRKVIERQKQQGAKISIDENLIKLLDYDEPLSLREGARAAGSTLGGGPRPGDFPTNRKKFYRAAEIIMSEQQSSPTPDRVGYVKKKRGKEKPVAGHHLDTRYRLTIGKESSTEVTDWDTMGGDQIKLAAQKYAAWALHQRFNEMSNRELATILPDIFKEKLNVSDYRRLGTNKFETDKYGTEAEITGAQGRKTNQELVEQLLDFLSRPYDNKEKNIHLPSSLPEAIRKELQKSARVPTEEDFRNARGTEIRYTPTGEEVVVPSIQGWYARAKSPSDTYTESGIGTPAHWRRARIKALERLGLSEEEIIEDYINDGQKAFAQHVEEIQESHIDELFADTAPASEQPTLIFSA